MVLNEILGISVSTAGPDSRQKSAFSGLTLSDWLSSVTPIVTLPPFGGPRSEVDIPGKPRTQERWETLV